MKKLFLLALAGLLTTTAVQAQRVTDRLTRGLVAIPNDDADGLDANYGDRSAGIYVSWRKLPTDYFDTQYNLYRNGTKLNQQPLSVCNYVDKSGSRTATYKVVPVVRGEERADQAAEAKPWQHQYWQINVQPVVGRDGTAATGYSLNDASVADVDGDGEMEFVVKRRNDSGNLLESGNKNNFNLHECYKMDGTRLWWIDMGPNLMAGPDEQFDLILYDWDQDGKAEALMRGADNMIIHTATGKEIKIGNMNYYAPRDEYTKEGAEYLLYLNGETGEPYAWDGSDNWTPPAYPLPRYEQGESNYASVWGTNDTGHRACKHYFGAPYLDGRNPAIFLGRGCYTRHKFCALEVNKDTHELTQLWRWNAYAGGLGSWFGNGFHNFAIADVDMDGRDEIVFGSMIIDDTGYGLSSTGYGHGDAQHCGDLDPYSWGLEQFVCLESATVPGICYTDATSSTVRYTTGAGADNGRCMAGNFLGSHPGAIGITFGYDAFSLVSDKVITGASGWGDDHMNMRIYWDGDLLDEFMDSPGAQERAPYVYKAPGQKEVGTGRSYTNSRCWGGTGNLNNSSKNNPSFLGDIIGDWREELVIRQGNESLRIFVSNYESPHAITSLWYDHEYRNGMTWQSVGYNQPPHPSFFLGELEGITKEPPAVTLEGREEVTSTIGSGDHLLVSGYEDKTISVQDGASPWVLTVNTPAWVQGTGSRQATAATPLRPQRNVTTYTTTLTGGAFGGAMHLVKQGEGLLVLPSVTEKHTGTTEVWQGTLSFDGTMESSPVWLNRHTSLRSNGGQFNAGIEALYNATLQPGGEGAVGTLSASSLTLQYGARVVFDITDANSCDKLNATTLTLQEHQWTYGPKYKAPVFEIKAAGTLAEGVYELGQVGTIEGQLSNVIIEGLDNSVKATLSHSGGKLLLSIGEVREAATIAWAGTDGNNTWQQAASENFTLDGQTVYSAAGDDVVFDDNAAVTDVVIRGVVSPRSVTFNNEEKTYTLSGDSIVGGGTFTKNNGGKVVLNNWNNTGNAVINAGTVSVSMLANNTGQTFGSLGNSKSTITLNDGATLQANGVIITDQTVNVSGEATIDVPSGKSVIFNKGLRGSGATVTKTGAGSMETGATYNYTKLVVKQGTVISNYTSGNVDNLPATVEMQGGTIWGANKEGTPYLTNKTNFIVPQGKTGVFYGSFGGTYTGTLTGAGTFKVYTGGVRCYFNGDWSEFTGTVEADKNNRQNKKSYDPDFNLGNSKGLPNATLKVNANCRVNNQGNNIVIGKLTGQGTLVGSGQWILGSDDKDFILSTEIGISEERKDDYGNTIAKSGSPVTKRGTGKMSLITAGKLYGALTVEGGIVAFNHSAMSSLEHGPFATTVKNGGTVMGQGWLNSVQVQSGGTLNLCGSTTNQTAPGNIKTTALTNILDGGTIVFNINNTKNSQLTAPNLTINGTVKVVVADDFTPKSGDEFTLWTVTGNLSGTASYELPTLPDGLYWNTDGLKQKTGVLRVTGNASDGIGRIGREATVSCEVYNTKGQLVGTVQAQRSNLRQAVRTLGVPAGAYVVKMQAGRNTESETIIVR